MAYAVITRDAEGSAPYVAALAPLGLELVAMPVTRSEPPSDPAALARAVGAGGYHVVVCASARAAGALVGALTDATGRAAGPVPEVWAVGPATARVLAAARLPAVWPEHVRDGASLARSLVAARELAGKRVLVPRAEEGRDDAIAILRAAGAIVDDIVAYRTVAVAADDPAVARGRELLASAQAAICVVLAPSQAVALDALVGVRTIAAGFAAIGETTAAALRQLGVHAVAVAPSPTPEGIANAIAAVYPARR